VLHPLPTSETDGNTLTPRDLAVLHRLLAELPLKTAVQLAMEVLERPRNPLYAAALAWQADQRESS
jgi:hypothetical protein